MEDKALFICALLEVYVAAGSEDVRKGCIDNILINIYFENLFFDLLVKMFY